MLRIGFGRKTIERGSNDRALIESSSFAAYFEKTDEFILAGKSNRAVLAFQEDFKKDVKEILNTLKFN